MKSLKRLIIHFVGRAFRLVISRMEDKAKHNNKSNNNAWFQLIISFREVKGYLFQCFFFVNYVCQRHEGRLMLVEIVVVQ